MNRVDRAALALWIVACRGPGHDVTESDDDTDTVAETGVVADTDDDTGFMFPGQDCDGMTWDGGFTAPDDGDLCTLSGYACITGDLYVFGSDVADMNCLSDLRGVGRAFVIRGNDRLLSLNGLQSLRSVRELSIFGNAKLENLEGLSGLTEVGYFGLMYNRRLRTLDGLNDAVTIDRTATIIHNCSLPQAALDFFAAHAKTCDCSVDTECAPPSTETGDSGFDTAQPVPLGG